ncbi:C6 zinc finger domain-containing protein [Fusarium denticulatum]|uniref:C6 zinc finger domain-containing protein n=1 Tax=Fusarium denticulatum TaxID=48507 RepID=A0A8H5XKY8_9HYPO|nr:C6 zinc finger domain-containing protein [Fusarium denticulatum]
MAALARRRRSQETLDHAFEEFPTALDQTNTSPAGPATAILNATLAAVLILGLFESIVSTSKENINSWKAHTVGTIALLPLRRFQQFGDILGRRTCVHAAYNICVSYINRAVEVPQALIRQDKDFYKAFNYPKAVRDHCSVMSKTCSIEAKKFKAVLTARAMETDHEGDLFSPSAGPVKEWLSRTSLATDLQALANTVMLHSATGTPTLAVMARRSFGMSMLLKEIV